MGPAGPGIAARLEVTGRLDVDERRGILRMGFFCFVFCFVDGCEEKYTIENGEASHWIISVRELAWN